MSELFTIDRNVTKVQNCLEINIPSFEPGIDSPICLPVRGKNPDTPEQRSIGGLPYQAQRAPVAANLIADTFPIPKEPKNLFGSSPSVRIIDNF